MSSGLTKGTGSEIDSLGMDRMLYEKFSWIFAGEYANLYLHLHLHQEQKFDSELVSNAD